MYGSADPENDPEKAGNSLQRTPKMSQKRDPEMTRKMTRKMDQIRLENDILGGQKLGRPGGRSAGRRMGIGR